MNAYEIPGLRFSMPAGGTIARHRFVSCNASGQAIQATNLTQLVGASYNQSASGEVTEIVGDGIAIVESGEAVAAGALVFSDANGKAVDSAGTIAAGVALTASTGAGQIISVKLAGPSTPEAT